MCFRIKSILKIFPENEINNIISNRNRRYSLRIDSSTTISGSYDYKEVTKSTTHSTTHKTANASSQ
jgi:hypothetical protein